MTHRSYSFESVWFIPFNLADSERAVIDFDAWTKWWPGLVEGKITKPKSSIVGSEINAMWRSILGYKLAMQLSITDYFLNNYIKFESKGDLVGTGSWSFKEISDSETRMVILWNVRTTKAWMNLSGMFLRPVFIYAHHNLMKKGELGLRRYLS